MVGACGAWRGGGLKLDRPLHPAGDVRIPEQGRAAKHACAAALARRREGAGQGKRHPLHAVYPATHGAGGFPA